MTHGSERSNYLEEPVTKKFSDDLENRRLYCGVSSMQGWRAKQEDRHFCILDYDRHTSLFGVFDGHGGHEVAQYAAEVLPDMIKNNFYRDGLYEKALIQAFINFDECLKFADVLRKLKKIRLQSARREEIEAIDKEDDEVILRTELAGTLSGTTATVALLRRNTLFVASVGDSRCVLATGGTEASALTRDHKPVDDMERLRIVKAGGRVGVDGRISHDLNMSRSLGDHRYKQNKRLTIYKQIVIGSPEVSCRTLRPENGDYFVIGSDGVWNSLSNQVVINFVSRRIRQPGIKLSSICEQLFDLCFSPQRLYCDDGLDNMTFIIVKSKYEILHLRREESLRTVQMVFKALSLD